MKIEAKIKKLIKRSDSIFIVAHKNLDLDAIGACVGIAAISNHFRKKNYIIIDDEKHELGVGKVIKMIQKHHKIIRSEEIPKYHQNKSLLIIADTNKAALLQNDRVLNDFDNIMILDHHQKTDQTITSTLKIIDENASSACEIITNLIQKYHVTIEPKEATIILSGIVLDTNNFTVKTDAYAYFASYYLAKLGADSKEAQSFLKQDIGDYLLRQKIISQVKVVQNKYAISVAPHNEKYKREELAKVADTLLQFHNIEASFVLGNRVDGGVGLSARSEGNVNVGEIAEMLGGGGDTHDAAAQIKDLKLEEVEEKLVKLIK